MSHRYYLLVVGLLLLLAACGGDEAATPAPTAAPATAAPEEAPTEAAPLSTNAVVVTDQAVTAEGTLTIDSVTADVAGWLVVHAQADGAPGPVLGFAPVDAGANSGVVVAIDLDGATDVLYAMLHVDAGAAGEYEFPGDDGPARDVDGDVVTPSFNITGGLPSAVTNAVIVVDQPISAEGTVTIDSVTADVAGWLVVHAQADGAPGPVLGFAPVDAGANSGVVVAIDLDGATDVLYAMLHVDAGAAGEYEFPGDDGPARDVDGDVVTPSFNITGGLPSVPLLLAAESGSLGTYLTDAAGMALYTFSRDVPGTSNCYDRCAVAWPPLLVDVDTPLSAGPGVTGELATTLRNDGTLQITYNEWPLYYWIDDVAPGDTTGHNVGNVWAVAYPETLVFLGGSEELGNFLVGPEGMTLYRFDLDEPGMTNCYDQCAVAWPPLLVEEGQVPTGNAGVVGELSTIARDDGTIQVTYEGMPLYYWIDDLAPGDTDGQAVNDVWWVVPPYTVRVGNNEELGDFLVAVDGLTLYLFTRDEENVSNCYDQCAIAWPPLLVRPGEVPVPGFGIDGELSVIPRDDDTLQVAYNGLPLYYWVDDLAPGDTNGQAVNDVWFVVAP